MSKKNPLRCRFVAFASGRIRTQAGYPAATRQWRLQSKSVSHWTEPKNLSDYLYRLGHLGAPLSVFYVYGPALVWFHSCPNKPRRRELQHALKSRSWNLIYFLNGRLRNGVKNEFISLEIQIETLRPSRAGEYLCRQLNLHLVFLNYYCYRYGARLEWFVL